MKLAHIERSIMRGRFVVIHHDPAWGVRSSAPLRYREACALARRFNNDLRRRMKTTRTITEERPC